MRALWKGAITFGLVTIPVSLFPATRREELKFRQLRASDHSPVNYKRVAEADGKEVPWDQIVKGYEYEKGKYVVLKEDDFRRADIEATQSVEIIEFVKLEEIDPMFFDRPYYLEPQKKGVKAYVLLREALSRSGNVDIGAKELEMARELVDRMTGEWEPTRYTDDYRHALLELIEKKIELGDKAVPAGKPPKKAASNVVDLASVLQESLEHASKAGAAKKRTAKQKRRLKKA